MCIPERVTGHSRQEWNRTELSALDLYKFNLNKKLGFPLSERSKKVQRVEIN